MKFLQVVERCGQQTDGGGGGRNETRGNGWKELLNERKMFLNDKRF